MMNMMKQVGMKPKGQSESANRERYKQHYTRFVESEFTYNNHLLLKRICGNGQQQPYMYSIPLYKLMLEVVKIMMMNELETLFFGSTLQEMKWKITDPCLNEYIDNAEDITPHLSKDTQTKKVQFSLLLIAYIVKIYLNQDSSLIDFKIRDIIKSGFDRMYQTWVNRVSNNFKFNPKSMNRIFKEYDVKHNEKQLQIVDYNKLVEEFFRQSDTNSYHEVIAEVEVPRYQEEIVYKPQPPFREEFNEQNSFYGYKSNSWRANSGRNDIEELPIQEEEEVPQISERRTSKRLEHRISEIGFTRHQSANQFFNPETTSRKGIFGLDLLRNSSRADDDLHD